MARGKHNNPLQDPTGAMGQQSDNGHGKGILDAGRLESLLQNAEFPSVAKEFVHPGKEPLELMMRCYFDDEREVNAAVLYLAKCDEFGDVEGKKVLLMKLAAKTSIKGKSRLDLLQAVTGTLLREYKAVKGQKDEKGNGL